MISPRLFIIHGYTAAPHHHWFDWLKGEAEALGIAVTVPALPDSQHPENDAWQTTLADCVGDVDDQTWFVGHSLGCTTALRYLARQRAGQNAAGIIMVAGFSDPLPTLPELNTFMSEPVQLERIVQGVPNRAVVASLNDTIVPPAFSLRLSQQLNAPLYGLPDSGHFLERDGITALPIVLQLLRQFTAKKS